MGVIPVKLRGEQSVNRHRLLLRLVLIAFFVSVSRAVYGQAGRANSRQ